MVFSGGTLSEIVFVALHTYTPTHQTKVAPYNATIRPFFKNFSKIF